MTQTPDFDLRYTLFSDEQDLILWLKQKANKKWFPVQEDKEIQFLAKNWINSANVRSSLTATLDNKPIGMATVFLMNYRKTRHQAMFYIIVDEKYQNQGIEHSLLRNVINLAKNYLDLESIYIEIFEGSPLVEVLENLAFVFFARQPYFVKQDNTYLARLLYRYDFAKEKEDNAK